MRFAVSVRTRSPSWTRAVVGRRNPATTSRSDVFPAPDGPKITVTRARISISTSRTKSARGRRRFLRSRFTLGPETLSHQVFAGPYSDKSQEDRNAQQPERAGVLAQLDEMINGQ